MITWARAVYEVRGVFLERISGGDQEEVTSRVSGWGVGVGSEDEAEWRQDNRVGG